MTNPQAKDEGEKKREQSPPRSLAIILALILMLIVAGLAPCLCAAQQAPSPAPPSANNTTRGPQNVTELASFLNTTISDELSTYHIPGATVAVVKDGKLFYANGYGYADLENKSPVDANASMFQIGSVCKLFTWTAVTQLVEEGKINLNADVNTYLTDFKIPETYPGQPVTMENLMTMTAGFEDQPRGVALSDPQEIQPLGATLAQTIPARLWPPGQVWSYSNWGAALAGYIVQEVSGVPFNQYITEKIFKPLGMNNTTIEQPVPPQLAPNVVKTYAYNNGAFQQTQDLTVGIPPAFAIHTTAPDMAKFMIAQLNDGQYNGTRILNTSTAHDMHSAHFTPDPYTSFAFGFFMGNESNESNINHAGDTLYFYTLCVLWPQRNVGLFVSYNSEGGASARYDLEQKFLAHYYPVTPTLPTLVNSNDAQSLTGTYQNTLNEYTTAQKYFADLGTAPEIVTGYPNGTLTLTSQGSAPLNLVEVAPLVFAQADGATTPDGSYYYIFTTGSNGTYFHLNALPQYFERLPWYATPDGVTNLGYLCLAVFASVALWPLDELYSRWRRWRGAESTAEGGDARLPSVAHWLMGITGVLYWMVFLIPFLLLHVLGFNGFVYLSGSLTIPPPIVAWLSLPLIAIALTVGGLALTILVWTRRYWTTFGKIHYTVVVGAALAFIVWLYYWNLIGFTW
jgi:CubicO group peptidase (beta-lactamase class C family)